MSCQAPPLSQQKGGGGAHYDHPGGGGSLCANCEHTKWQNILIYNLLFKLNSKHQSFKINYCANYLQLKARHVFKNKSIKFDKGSLNTGITRYFLIWWTRSPSQAKFRVHSLMVKLKLSLRYEGSVKAKECTFLPSNKTSCCGEVGHSAFLQMKQKKSNFWGT